MVMTRTMMAPIRPLTIEPRPPPRLLPPTTAAVSAKISEIEAGSGSRTAEAAGNQKGRPSRSRIRR